MIHNIFPPLIIFTQFDFIQFHASFSTFKYSIHSWTVGIIILKHIKKYYKFSTELIIAVNERFSFLTLLSGLQQIFKEIFTLLIYYIVWF